MSVHESGDDRSVLDMGETFPYRCLTDTVPF